MKLFLPAQLNRSCRSNFERDLFQRSFSREVSRFKAVNDGMETAMAEGLGAGKPLSSASGAGTEDKKEGTSGLFWKNTQSPVLGDDNDLLHGKTSRR